MKRKIFVLGAFIMALCSLNSLNAQDFVKNEVHLFGESNPVGDRMVIKQGETKKLRGYITVVSDNESQKFPKAKDAVNDVDYIYEKLINDMEKITEAEKTEGNTSRTDTLYIIADSVILEKISQEQDDGYTHYTNGVFLYKGEQSRHQIDSWYSNDLEDAIDNFGYALKKRFNTKSNNAVCDKEYTPKKRILSSGLVFGYGYLNYSDNGLFSTPSSDDPYSLKWSDKWDVIYRFTFFPDHAVSLTTGIGIQSNVFRFDDGFDINAFNINPPTANLSKEKCKLVARYITVPLIADFHISEHFNIHAGFIGGINYRNSHTGFKRNYKIDGEKTEQSTGSSFKDFNAFKADAMVGLEIHGWTFYVSHSLTNMFKDSYVKEAMPFSFGVMLGL